VHPNIETLTRFYAAFATGDVSGMLAACGDGVTFQVPGKSKLAGKYDRSTFGPRLIETMKTLGGGSFRSDVHDITATDAHGLVLMTNTVTRGGVKHEYRTVHVWRIQGGRPIAWYEYPRDLYQFDAIWS
jgi:ketosteroid isomerase-like protein